MRLNLARVLERSAVNGPGERFVIWVQGCPLACPGCWNPDTWAFERREQWDVEALAERIRQVEGIEGLTFTGGEPFAQAAALAELATLLPGLSVVIFTGYTLEELRKPAHKALLSRSDILVAGRYIEEHRSLDLPLRGSSNQVIHFLTHRYQEADLEPPGMEVHIDAGGGLTLTGFPEGEWG